MADDVFVPRALARLLVEHDRLDVLRAEAGRGDRTCGEALAAELFRRGEVDAALEIYRSFGWPDGWVAAARPMVAPPRLRQVVHEAIAFVRPYADAGDPGAVRDLAMLLGGEGRADEVLALLRPLLGDWSMVRVLVEAMDGLGRDDDVMAELETLMADLDRHPHRWQAEVCSAPDLLATMLERQGRFDEAIAVLRRVRGRSVNRIEQLAELLRTAGREAELREFVAGDGSERAVSSLAKLLEDQGRLAEAVEVCRPFVDDGHTCVAITLADLLHRHGRTDEAVEVGCTAVRATHPSEYPTDRLWGMLIEAGRPHDALDHLDRLERDVGSSETLFHDRIWLLMECGRPEEALDRVRAHPEADTNHMVWHAAAILHVLGRVDEAIAVLRPRVTALFIADTLAELLLLQGRVDEAMAAIHGQKPREPFPDPFAGIPTT